MKNLLNFINVVSGLINHMLDEVIICDRGGIIHYSNSIFLSSFGHELKSIKHKHINTLIDFAPFSKLETLFRLDDILIKDLNVRLENNQLLSRKAAIHKIFGPSSKYSGFAIVLQKENSEIEGFRKYLSSNKFLSIINQRNDAVWFSSDIVNRVTVFITDSLLSITGWSTVEFYRGGWLFFLSLIHPEDLPGLIESHAKWMMQRNQFGLMLDHIPYHYSVRFRHRNTSYISMDVEYNVQMRMNNNVRLIFGSYRPIPDNTMITRDVFRQFDGKTFVDLDFLKNLQQRGESNSKKLPSLSLREREVMDLLVNGSSTDEIATKLHLSKHTVNTHRKQIIRKMGAKNIADLVKKYLSQH